MMPPEGICFDVTGTLIDLREDVGTVYRRVALDYGVDLPAWRLDDAFRRVVARAGTPTGTGASYEERAEAERHAWYDLIRQTFQAADSTVRFNDFAGFAQTLVDLFASKAPWQIRGDEDVLRDILKTCAAAGPPMVVLTNFDYRIREILQVFDLERYFSEIINPTSCGHHKPERAAFETAAKALGCSLGGLLYVGDDSAKRMGAIEEHGLSTYAITPDSDWRDVRSALALPATV